MIDCHDPHPSGHSSPKLFVLDTNVILHDADCIRNFEENDVAVPITVLEELDRFKKGNDDIHAQDYTSDKVENVDKLYPGKRLIENTPSELIDAFYTNGGLVHAAAVPEIVQPIANENFIFRNGSKSVLAVFRASEQGFQRVEKLPAYGITPYEVKTIITRAGEGTKMVFTGDIHQVDHPYLDSLSNGLSYLISRMMGQPIYAHITLEKGERSALADLASDLL